MRSLENREILLKVTTRKITRQEGGFLNFVRPLMPAGLPLMKNILTSLAKSVLVPLGLTATASSTDPTVRKKRAEERAIRAGQDFLSRLIF